MAAAAGRTGVAAGKGKAAATTDVSHLENAVISVVTLREFARRELVKILQQIKGGVHLVLDRSMVGPINLIADMKLLKEHGVEAMTYLDPVPMSSTVTNLVYLVRPQPSTMKLISKQIHGHTESGEPAHKYHVYFVPRRTMLCERVLAEQGVYGDISTGEFHLDLIPFEQDVLSLELPNAFRECFLMGDPTALYYVARSIMTLQAMFGIIPVVHGKGDNAFQVFSLMRRMRAEAPAERFDHIVPEIQNLILIDRNVDLVTPLLTQRTYEGLIDEIFHIQNGLISVPAEAIDFGKKDNPKAPPKDPKAMAKVQLNSADTLYSDIRDLNFRVLGPLLHKKAAEIAETYNKKDSLSTISELTGFMKEFKSAHEEHNYLQTHIYIASQLSETTKSPKFDAQIDAENSMVQCEDQVEVEKYILGLIAKIEPFLKVLRLLCLYSLTFGIKQRTYDMFKTEMIQTYGYEVMFTLNNLSQMGLFRAASSKWSGLRKHLRLTIEEDKVDLQRPMDLYHIFTQYAPLSVRLVEMACSPGGWKNGQELLKSIPGRTYTYSQELPVGVQERTKIAQQRAGPAGKKPVSLVYFIGGATFSEISAVRALAERESMNRDFIIATTKLVNGDSLLQPLVENVDNNLSRSTLPGALGKGRKQ